MKKLACVMVMVLFIVISCPVYADSSIDLSHYDIDDNTVSVSATHSYTVQYKSLDLDLLCSTLLGTDCQYERNDAYGIWYTSTHDSDIDRLGLFDTDYATPNGSGFDGGFTYNAHHDDISFDDIIGVVANGKSVFEAIYQDDELLQSSLNKDLSFATLNEAISSVDEIISSIGLDSFRCVVGYGLERDSVIDSIIQNDVVDSDRIAQYADVLTDCYVLFYQQFIDELPVNDTMLSDKMLSKDDPTETFAAAIVSQNGIETMYVINAYDVIASENEGIEHDFQEALDIIQARISKGLNPSSLQIEKITKVLYPIGNVSTGISLRPAWCISTVNSSQKYKNYIIDTHTLEIYE